MSATAQEAFEKYYDQLDPYGPNRGTQQIFIDGFNAACAQLAALKEENERLSKVCAIAEGLAEECDTLKARVVELEKNNFRLGLIAAAVVIENKVAEYDYEHGRTEPDTNCRVYPGDGEDYVYSMNELAEELRMIADKEPNHEG